MVASPVLRLKCDWQKGQLLDWSCKAHNREPRFQATSGSVRRARNLRTLEAILIRAGLFRRLVCMVGLEVITVDRNQVRTLLAFLEQFAGSR